MRRADGRTTVAAMAATLAGMAWIAYAAMGSPPINFRLLDVQPMVFVERTLSGKQTPHQAYQADVAAYPGAAKAHMEAYAERLFADQLRDMADRDGKSEVWITFHLGHAVVDGAKLTKTFRAIYVHDETGWESVGRRLATNARAELK